MSPAAAAASASSEPAFWELFYLSWGTSHASFRLPELGPSPSLPCPAHLTPARALTRPPLSCAHAESIAQLLAIPFLLPPFAPSLAARCPTLAHQPFARATGLLQAGPDDDDAGAADAAAKWDVEGRPVCPIALRSEADAARLCARMVSVKCVVVQARPPLCCPRALTPPPLLPPQVPAQALPPRAVLPRPQRPPLVLPRARARALMGGRRRTGRRRGHARGHKMAVGCRQLGLCER